MSNPRYTVSIEDGAGDFFTGKGAETVEAAREATREAMDEFREFVLTEAESLQASTDTVDGLRDLFIERMSKTTERVLGALERLPWPEGRGCKWRSGIQTDVDEYPEVFLVIREGR